MIEVFIKECRDKAMSCRVGEQVESSQKRNLLLGLGNTILKDDGVGIYAVEKIRQMHPKNGWDIEISPLSGCKLIDIVLGYHNVVIVDSILLDDRDPGEIITFHLNDLKTVFGSSPHYIGLPFTLEMAGQMNLEIPENIRVVAINVKDPYTFHEGLSEEIETAMPALVREVEDAMMNLTAPAASHRAISSASMISF